MARYARWACRRHNKNTIAHCARWACRRHKMILCGSLRSLGLSASQQEHHRSLRSLGLSAQQKYYHYATDHDRLCSISDHFIIYSLNLIPEVQISFPIHFLFMINHFPFMISHSQDTLRVLSTSLIGYLFSTILVYDKHA